MKRLGGELRPWRWNLVKDTMYPLGGLGSQWSTASASSRSRRGNTGAEESLLLKLQQPALSQRRWEPVIDDGRQSSAATSLTGILRDEGRRLRCYVLEGARAREDGKGSKDKNDGGRRKE